MSINSISRITANELLNESVFLISVEFPEMPKPGQFVMVSTADNRSDPYLPRPISVFDWENGVLRMLIKIVGRGTDLLSKMRCGEMVRVVGHLGNSFPDSKESVIFAGGGIGIAPLFYAAKCSQAKKKSFVLGFRKAEEVILVKEFEKLGNVAVTTDDGSFGFHGNPASYIAKQAELGDTAELVCACGPEIMMEKIHEALAKTKARDFHSLESRMGCGIGACLGCRVTLKGGSFLVCKEGPVFEGKRIFGEVKP